MNDILSHLADQAMGTLSDLEPWLPPTFAATPDDRDVVSEIEPTDIDPTSALETDARFDVDPTGTNVESPCNTKSEATADQADTRVSPPRGDATVGPLAGARTAVIPPIAPAGTPHLANERLVARRESEPSSSTPDEGAPDRQLLLPKPGTKSVTDTHAIQPAIHANDSTTPTDSDRYVRENCTRPTEPATTKIEVTIGRIEIRAVSPSRKTSPEKPRPVESKALSLSDYLAMRGRRYL